MSKKPILFQDAGSDSDVEIKTNNEYATHYDKWRQKEEMNRCNTFKYFITNNFVRYFKIFSKNKVWRSLYRQ